jgi:hypothetical protein
MKELLNEPRANLLPPLLPLRPTSLQRNLPLRRILTRRNRKRPIEFPPRHELRASSVVSRVFTLRFVAAFEGTGDVAVD